MQATDFLRRAVRAVGLGPDMRNKTIGEGITGGCVVALRYTLRLDSGKIVESFHGHPPFLYLHGAGNLVPGLEQALAGRRVADRMRIAVPPELGYGPVRPELVKRIARSELPSDMEPVLGMKFRTAAGEGTALPAWVAGLEDDELVISFNHPLAGETLHFSVEVISIREARLSERSHGHPHGPDSRGSACPFRAGTAWPEEIAY